MIGIERSKLRKNMILSGITRPLSIIISFIYVPLVLNYLGIEKYGIWSTILSILSWISFFDIGIGNGLRNKLAERLTRNVRESKELISTAYVFVTIIVLLIFPFLFVGINLLDWKSIFGVTHLSDDISRVIIVSVIFVSLNFIISLCKSIFYALQNAAAVSWMELSIQVLNLILIIIASKYSSENLLMMAILYGASLISVSVLASIFLFYKNPSLIPSLRYFRFDIGKEITSLGLQFFIIQISALVLFTTDNLIISSLYGASNVTPYTTVNKLFTVVSSFYLAIITPLWSSFTVAKAKKDLTWMRNIYKKIHFLMIPFFLGIIGLGLLFRSITLIWLGRNLDYQSGLIFLGAIYGALTIWCNTYAMIGNGLGLMRVSVITAIAQAVINIPLSLFCAITLNMQSSGVLLGTVLAMLISASIIPIFVYMYIFKSGSELV